MANQNFSKRLRQLRRNNDYTLEELGRKLNVKKATVAKWENLGVVPNSDILKKLSSIFSVSIDYLLGNEVSSVSEIEILHRGLNKLNQEEVKKATVILGTMFDNIFEDEDDEDDI